MFKHKPKTTLKWSLTLLLSGWFKVVLFVVALTGVFLYTRAGMPAHVSAATSDNLNFQARLLSSSGAIVPDGDYHIEFKLYNHVTNGGQAQGTCSGNCLWSETYTTGNLLTVKNGYLSVQLGSLDSLADESIDWDQDLYLTMRVGGSSGSPSWDTEMGPRLKLTAVPYAYRSGGITKYNGAQSGNLSFGTVANSPNILLPDIAGTNNLLLQSGTTLFTQGSVPFTDSSGRLTQDNANFFYDSANQTLGVGTTRSGAIDGTGNSRLLVRGSGTTSSTSALNVVNSSSISMLFVRDDGNVGIGTTTPGARLQVNAAASGIGVIIRANATTPGNTLEIQDSTGEILSGFNAAGDLFIRDQSTGNRVRITVAGGTIASGDVELRLPDVVSGSVICTSANNCVGVGGAGDVYNGGQPTGTLVLGTDDAEDFFLQTDDTNRIQISDTGIVSILSGNLEVGVPSSVTGSFTLYNAANSHAAIIQSTALSQPTTFTLPDVNFATATICVMYDSNETNCAGTGSSVTQSGTNAEHQIAFFTNGNNITSSANYLFNSSTNTLSLTGTLDVTGDSTYDGNLIVEAGHSLTLTGGNTASRPASPTEGMLYYDTDTNSLLIYSNGKWQADRAESIIVAASNSTQAQKDSADYVTDGTSDQVEINAALTAAAGGKVYLLPGTYVAGGTILIPNNTTLAGAGRGTLIELADIDASDNLIENSDKTTGTGITIRDLRLDGRSDLNTTGSQEGIYLDNMGDGSGASARQGAKLTNLWVNNFRSSGINLDNSSNGNFENITIQNTGGIAFYSFMSSYNTFTGNTVKGSYVGFYIDTSSDYNTLTGNVVEDATDRGVYIYDSYHNTLSGNIVSNVDTTGYEIGDSTHNTLVGNTAHNITGVGFLVLFAERNLLTGNTATQNGVGFWVDSADYSTVSGNTVHDSSSDGIFLASNHVTLTGNSIHNSGGAAFNNGIHLVSADSNNITSNIITDTQCTTTCYAINISSSTSDSNYLADNYYTPGTINDAGTGTIYGGQLNGSGNYVIQPAGDINLNADTYIDGNLEVTGDALIEGSLTVETDVIIEGALEVGSTGQFQVDATGNVVTSGTIQYAAGAADTTTVVCQNSLGQLAACNTTGTGAAFVQGGNSFSAQAVLGTNDNNSLAFRTNNADRLILDTSGNLTFQQASIISTSGATSLSVDTGGAAALNLGTTNANAVSISRAGVTTTINGTLSVVQASTFTGLATFNGGVTVTTGNTFTNASSTLLTAISIGNLPSGGAIGTAATTVDVATTFNVTQNTNNQTLTLPSPTVTTAGRLAFVSNTGTNSFTMYGVIIAPGSTATYMWNGTVWTSAGVDGTGNNYIQNQNANNQTASFRINGTGRANGGFLAPSFDAAAAGSLGIGTTTATSILIGQSGVTTTNNGALTVAELLTAQSGLTVTGTTNINTTGTAATTIGNSSADLTLQGSTIVLNTDTLQRTAAGTTTIDLSDAADTTLAVTNSGGGFVHLSVDGIGFFYAVSLGESNAIDGAIQFLSSQNGFSQVLLTSNILSDDRQIYLPDENGTLCIQGASSCGFAMGAGDAFVNGGNSFGTTTTIGTNDAQDLIFRTANADKLTLTQAGDLTFAQSSTIGVSAADGALTVQSNGNGAATFDSGTTGNVNIGTGATAKTVTIGNTTGATAVVINTGTGGAAINGNTTVTGSALAGGTSTLQVVPANHSAVTAEVNNLRVQGNTQTITGSYTTQRFNVFNTSTITAASALTVTNAATVAIEGAPVRAGSAAITNSYALLIQSSAVGTATNSYGLSVNAQTGATNNYAAIFQGGNVGIGTATPGQELDVVGDAQFSDRTFVPGASGTTARGYFTGNESTPLGAYQSVDLFGTTYTYFTTNKYFNGSVWLDNGMGRTGSALMLANDSLTFNSFNTAAVLTTRFIIASGGNVGVGGDATPDNLFSVGNTSQFQVNASGDITTPAGEVLNINTGNNGAGASGAISSQTGTGTTSTGSNTVSTGNASAGTSGATSVTTGTGTTGTGSITIRTGNASAGTAGNVNIETGTSSSGTAQINIGDQNIAKRVDVGSVDNSATTTVNIATASGAAQTIQVGGTGLASQSNAGTTLALQGGATALRIANAAATIQSHNDSATAFQVTQANNTAVLTVDTTTAAPVVKIGTVAAPSLGSSVRLLTTVAQVTTRLLVGDTTNGIDLNVGATAGEQFRLMGSARNDISIVLSPEFQGATLTGDGTNNVGTMTSDFCANNNTNIPNINTGVCTGGSAIKHNYYSWTANATNDYDIWLNWQVPSNFDALQTANAIQFYGWRSSNSAGTSVTMTVYNAAGTVCGVATSITNTTTWSATTYNQTGCSPSAGDILTFRITLSVGVNNQFARMGEILINYKAKF